MKKIRYTTIVLFLVSIISKAQIPTSASASEILLQMKRMQVLGSVLYIAAHPDDENTRLLAWLSQDKLYRTGYLSLTRGDGGQNLIGDEQGIELGLIRTQELMAARRVDGAEQFFSTAYDFGFSKTTAEALQIWDEKKILSNVVWIIRKFQPDIIITRFPEDKRAGHGQHSASSVLARLAYSAAADPNQFPEQFAYGVKPWQAKRLFLNTYRFGSFNTTSEDQLKIEVGNFNPLLGKSYGEIAADSRSQHRSQGFGATHTRGSQLEYFSLTEGEKADSSLMQNINSGWSRISGGEGIGQKIDLMIRNYDPVSPYKSLESLVEIYKLIKTLPEGSWRDEKLKETVGIIQACSGVWIEATAAEGYAVVNQNMPVTVRIVNRSPVSITLNSVSLNRQDSNLNLTLVPNVNYSWNRRMSLRGISVSQPYWLVEPMSPGSYNVQDQTLIGMPQNPPALQAVFDIILYGQSFALKQPVFYKYTDPVKGEFFEPITIVPAQMAYCDPDLMVFTPGKEKGLVVRRQIKTAQIAGDDKSVIHQTGLSAENKSSVSFSPVTLTPIPGFITRSLSISDNTRDFELKSSMAKNENTGTWVTQQKNNLPDTLMQCRTISYDHIPRIDYFKQAKSTVVSVDLLTKGNRIGYIEGAGDKMQDALVAMGYSVVKLNENSITSGNLQHLDAVITGLRAYDVHDWLSKKYQVLMEYIKNGGNLIVQYNRSLDDTLAGIGPFPFGISNARVTEENASVEFLLPKHQVLHFPNEITQKDFEGWIQERGIYFAQLMDPKYESVLSMHDAGEPEQKGSLIIGNYGKGYFTYTGLVFFRELPAGVPGAYRLLANIIALNQNHKN